MGRHCDDLLDLLDPEDPQEADRQAVLQQVRLDMLRARDSVSVSGPGSPPRSRSPSLGRQTRAASARADHLMSKVLSDLECALHIDLLAAARIPQIKLDRFFNPSGGPLTNRATLADCLLDFRTDEALIALVTHCDQMIFDLSTTMHGATHFYIGITTNSGKRWGGSQDMPGHCLMYESMHLLCAVDGPRAALLERALLKQGLGPHGSQCSRPTNLATWLANDGFGWRAHPMCNNKSPGGERHAPKNVLEYVYACTRDINSALLLE